MPHQVEFGEYVESGLARFSVATEITTDAAKPADMHVVIGPHYAKHQWLGHPRVLLIDRCFWGHHREYISIGWMTTDGGRVYPSNMPGDRPKPILHEKKCGSRVIELVDYGRAPRCEADTIRYHPADRPCHTPLCDALDNHDIAVGHSTSALVTALAMGLRVIATDNRHPVYNYASVGRDQVFNNLSYANWHGGEIATGTPFEYLL